MTHKVVHILARNLAAAEGIACSNKNLDINSGKWVSSIPLKKGRIRTYSFEIDDSARKLSTYALIRGRD